MSCSFALNALDRFLRTVANLSLNTRANIFHIHLDDGVALAGMVISERMTTQSLLLWSITWPLRRVLAFTCIVCLAERVKDTGGQKAAESGSLLSFFDRMSITSKGLPRPSLKLGGGGCRTRRAGDGKRDVIRRAMAWVGLSTQRCKALATASDHNTESISATKTLACQNSRTFITT